MRDHGSIGLPLGMGSFGGFFFRLLCVFWLLIFLAFFLFLFLFSAGREKKSLAHGILVGNQREKTILGRGSLSFFFRSFGDNSVLFRYCLVKRPFCTFLLVSLVKNFLSFLFYFLPFFGWEFSFFSFCFLPLFDWEFPFFSFFASEGKDYSES